MKMELKKEEIVVGATITLSKCDFVNIKQMCCNINNPSIAAEFRLKDARALAHMFGFSNGQAAVETDTDQPATLYDVEITAVKNGADIAFSVGREWRNLSGQQKEVLRDILGPWCEFRISEH